MAAGVGGGKTVSSTYAPVRFWLLMPSWLIIGFFMLLPVLLMLIYSFLTKEFRGGVEWEFSGAAYALDCSGTGRDVILPSHRISDSLFHCDTPTREPVNLAVSGDDSLLGQSADPHRLDEVSDPQSRGSAWVVLFVPALHGLADLRFDRAV